MMVSFYRLGYVFVNFLAELSLQVLLDLSILSFDIVH